MSTIRLRSYILVSTAATLLACAEPSAPVNAPLQLPPPAPDASDDDAVDAAPPNQCPGAGGIEYQQPAPNVLLLVDRSGSMGEPGACATSTCPTKWQQLLALGSYLGDVKTRARLGMNVFPAPGDPGCGVSSEPLVPISQAPDVDQQILQAVATVGPGGRTPIAAALDEIGDSGLLDDATRDNVVVLLTDGMPNCACEDDGECERDAAVAAVTALRNRAVPIRVDVVGFGYSADTASDTLSAMAVAAGTDLPGEVKYFRAGTIEELIARLYQVAAGLAPCRFSLDDRPPPAELVVHLDDTEVAACENAPCGAGYVYQEAQGMVELYGASCAAIRDGQCHQVWFERRSGG